MINPLNPPLGVVMSNKSPSFRAASSYSRVFNCGADDVLEALTSFSKSHVLSCFRTLGHGEMGELLQQVRGLPDCRWQSAPVFRRGRVYCGVMEGRRSETSQSDFAGKPDRRGPS